jgi:hypothetical protein
MKSLESWMVDREKRGIERRRRRRNLLVSGWISFLLNTTLNYSATT